MHKIARLQQEPSALSRVHSSSQCIRLKLIYFIPSSYPSIIRTWLNPPPSALTLSLPFSLPLTRIHNSINLKGVLICTLLRQRRADRKYVKEQMNNNLMATSAWKPLTFFCRALWKESSVFSGASWQETAKKKKKDPWGRDQLQCDSSIKLWEIKQ